MSDLQFDKMRSPRSQQNFNQLEQDFTKLRLNAINSHNTRSSSKGMYKKDNDYHFDTIPTSENTPSHKRIPHSSKNSINIFKTQSYEADVIPPLQTSTNKNEEKLSKLFTLFAEDNKRYTAQTEPNKPDNLSGYIMSLTNRKSKEEKKEGPYKKHDFFQQTEEKPRTNKVLKTIQTITIDLNKEKRPVNYINRPIVQFDNKAELKFDMNYILESSPTNFKRAGLITLEHLKFERMSKRIEPKDKFVIENKIRAIEKKSGDDSFFDFSSKIPTKRKIHHVQNNSHNIYSKNFFNF